MLPLVHQVVRSQCRFPDQPGRGAAAIHPTHVLALHLRAQGTLHYEREDLVARPPYLVLLPRGERDRHRLRGAFDGYWCLFESDLVESDAGPGAALRGSGPRVARSHMRQLAAPEARACAARFAELAIHARRGDAASRLRASALVLELLAQWADAEEGHHGAPSAVEVFRAAIERDACDPAVSLAALAREAGLGLSHLGERFRRSYALTPVAYRAQLRLARARELLLTSALPMAAVAREAGFADATYFARAFRRACGTTPARYARAHALIGGSTPRARR